MFFSAFIDDDSRNEESSDEENDDIRHKFDQFRAAGGFDAFGKRIIYKKTLMKIQDRKSLIK